MLGVCGGAMVLGTDVRDPSGVEGAATGLGLLPLCDGDVADEDDPPAYGRVPAARRSRGPRSAAFTRDGYEIRNGTSQADGCEVAPLVWRSGSVLATTVHGLLEDPDVVHALCGIRVRDPLEDTFDLLADAVEAHLDTRLLTRSPPSLITGGLNSALPRA